MKGAAPAVGNLAAVRKAVRQLAKRVEKIERLLVGHRNGADLDPDLRAELAAWDAASDEALRTVEKRSK